MTLDNDPSSLRNRSNTDAQLHQAISGGDEGGLRAAVAEYGGFVHGMALLILQQPKLAEQVAHDTFVMLWRNPESFNPRGGSLKVFLTGVARSKAIDLVRHEEVRAEETPPAEAPRWLWTSLPTCTTQGGDEVKMRTALNRLHPSKREALLLAYFRGFTYREVSEVLDIQVETAKARIRDALMSLRSSMLT